MQHLINSERISLDKQTIPERNSDT